jgi:NDP-sugar pyrophosphorylase family protein
MNIVILAAGRSKRFLDHGIDIPKPFVPIGDMCILDYVVKNVYNKNDNIYIVVLGKDKKFIENTHFFISKRKNINVYYRDSVSLGPADTASQLILDSDICRSKPLLVINCDQYIFDFDVNTFKTFCDMYEPIGVIGTYTSTEPHNSYVLVGNDGRSVISVKEKVVISNVATNGLHYWKSADYFLMSKAEMESNNDFVNGELYIAPTYNYLVNRLYNIIIYHFNMHFPLGTIKDVEYFRFHKLWKHIK